MNAVILHYKNMVGHENVALQICIFKSGRNGSEQFNSQIEFEFLSDCNQNPSAYVCICVLPFLIEIVPEHRTSTGD